MNPLPKRAGLLLLLLLAACQAPAPPPVVERSTGMGTTASGRQVPDQRATHYRVQAGDTLYSIAWRFGQDYRELAARNGIGPPYRIYPNQELVLRGPVPAAPAGRPPASATVPQPGARPAPQPQPQPQPQPPQRPPSTAQPALPSSPSATAAGPWQWPAQGEILRDFGGSNRGIDMQVPAGRRVVSVAAGEVVYAGAGLRGYRHLVIVKHDARYLSAYSFNDQMRVREGENIKAGALLADISSTGPSANLRFEIRLDGNPIDPRQVLR